MPEKDALEKKLLDYADVFADIWNVLLFGGRRIIAEQDLSDALPRSIYKSDGKVHEQERDVAKLMTIPSISSKLPGCPMRRLRSSEATSRLLRTVSRNCGNFTRRKKSTIHCQTKSAMWMRQWNCCLP